MSKYALGYINQALESLNIPYQFMEWDSRNELPDTYFIGEYSEQEPTNEDGMIDTMFILTGTTKEKYIVLESVKDDVMELFPSTGTETILPNGNGLMIAYSTSFPIPSIEEGVHRIQITLHIKEWMV